MNGCFSIFHTPNDSVIRDRCFEEGTAYLEKHFNKLNTPTIKIKDKEGVKGFLKDNKDFKLNLSGWDPKDKNESYDFTNAKPQGWLYGPIGIWASNFTAWKSFLDTDYDYALLVEDDVTFHPDFFTLLTMYMEELPPNWDVFHVLIPNGERGVPHTQITKHLAISYQRWSNAVYVISRQGAEKALNHILQEGITLPIDWHWFKQKHFYNAYSVTPQTRQGCRLVSVRSTYDDFSHFVNLSFLKDEL